MNYGGTWIEVIPIISKQGLSALNTHTKTTWANHKHIGPTGASQKRPKHINARLSRHEHPAQHHRTCAETRSSTLARKQNTRAVSPSFKLQVILAKHFKLTKITERIIKIYNIK